MSFLWVTISVRSMKESLAFYRDAVGLTIDRQFTAPNGTEFCFLGSGETKVELIADPSHPDTVSCEGLSIGFRVPSVDEHIAFLRTKGVEVESGPFQPTPHIRFFFVKDPSGVSVQFVEES